MKMKFLEDKFYGDKCIFKAGEIYEVHEELGWAERWIKRGGIVIEEKLSETIEPKESHNQTANPAQKKQPKKVQSAKKSEGLEGLL